MKRSIKRQLSVFMTISTVMLSLFISSRTAYESAAESPDSAILRVITKPSINTYFEGKNGPDGMEFQLIQAFANKHHYQLELILTENSDHIYNALDQGLADVALVGQPMSLARLETYPKTPAYMESTTQLIYRSGDSKPVSFDDLSGKTIVVENTEQNREKYRLLKSHYGNIHWQFTHLSIDQLLSQVNKGKIDFTIIDSRTYLSKHPLYTHTRIAFDLYYSQPVSLALSKSSSPVLRASLTDFIANAKSDGTVDRYLERFYSHDDNADRLGSTSFAFLMNNRLPIYADTIKQVANTYNMDWRLLAAIAYQESHWDPEARSPTGVRGMMMLTNDTAMDMGVEDRVNVEQSLNGGAKYFKQIYKELPASIAEPDRTWFALAAYNVGQAHLLDAMDITTFHDENPNLWSDVKKRLPLLAKKEWNQFTRYGHARGQEPVNYVQNIRHYYNILEWHFPLQYNEKQDSHSQIIVRLLDDVIQDQRTPGFIDVDDKLRVTGLFF